MRRAVGVVVAADDRGDGPYSSNGKAAHEWEGEGSPSPAWPTP